ncbi:MAG: hypothetical protein ACKVZH_03325 [Blastocatellia bacterium]
MSLAQLWQQSGDQLSDKRVQQIIAIAGDGKLRDGNATSLEFREFLSQVSSDVLHRYAEECLKESFTDSGLVLQDIINQVGRRLGFAVTDGRYQGVRGENGFDGLWRFPDGHCVVVEVKTTDAYRIDSDKIAGYRKRLIAGNEINEEQSSILIVVGRNDTGDLEAQIRGSRHAWDIRLISVDALARLMLLKESVDDPRIIGRICNILIPREFTRLDEIIEIVFFTTEEAKQPISFDDEEETEEEVASLSENQVAISPVAFQETCIERFGRYHEIKLIKRFRAGFSTSDESFAVICAVSKTYNRGNQKSFWFTFRPYHKDFLGNCSRGFLLLGCGSIDFVLAVSYNEVLSWLNDLWTTGLEDKMYWHIRIRFEQNEFFLERKNDKGRLNVTQFLLPADSVTKKQF